MHVLHVCKYDMCSVRCQAKPSVDDGVSLDTLSEAHFSSHIYEPAAAEWKGGIICDSIIIRYSIKYYGRLVYYTMTWYNI